LIVLLASPFIKKFMGEVHEPLKKSETRLFHS